MKFYSYRYCMMIATNVTEKGRTKGKTKKAKKSNPNQKITSDKKNIHSDLRKDIDIKWDKVLEKVEKMVEKNWEITEKDIRKRKSERKNDDYKNVSLDVMISRISEESKKHKNDTTFAKNFLYFVYFLIIVAIFIFLAKWLLVSKYS